MFDFTQITLVIGKRDKVSGFIQMLGSGFLISNYGKVVTARHVVGNETEGLCVLMPHIPNINAYQDLSDTSCRSVCKKRSRLLQQKRRCCYSSDVAKLMFSS